MRRRAAPLGLLVLVAGCPTDPRLEPLEPLPVDQAVALVNANAAGLAGGFKATGPVDGRFDDAQGNPRRFGFNGKLLVVPPYHLRFDVQNAFGRSEFLAGSNPEFFWLHAERDADTLRYGRHATPDAERALELPLRPDWLLEGLGLNALAVDGAGKGSPVQIIEPDRQRLLFVSLDEEERATIRREYWLSRYAPRLIERVVFRDSIGVELMHSELSDYRQSGDDGALLPHRIRLDWPAQGAWIEFQARRWQKRAELTPEHPAFELLPWDKLTGRYGRVVDVDSGRISGAELSAPPP
ncbi:MAG: hypothetical protein GY842_27340 [bacterium]|nr:hypothetical protein [bacterium]